MNDNRGRHINHPKHYDGPKGDGKRKEEPARVKKRVKKNFKRARALHHLGLRESDLLDLSRASCSRAHFHPKVSQLCPTCSYDGDDMPTNLALAINEEVGVSCTNADRFGKGGDAPFITAPNYSIQRAEKDATTEENVRSLAPPVVADSPTPGSCFSQCLEIC
jgi:hypothetical protein